MATLTNQSKNRQVSASGGGVFYGWLFWFTTAIPGAGQLTNASKHGGTITNQAKH
jgi:hypothetical protein